jgi:hypothetical protein
MPSFRRPRHVVTRQRELEAKAHQLRQHPTLSEQRLWSALRASRLGLPFRRQVVIGRFIAEQPRGRGRPHPRSARYLKLSGNATAATARTPRAAPTRAP